MRLSLERLAYFLQDVAMNFDIDTFQKMIKEIEKLTKQKYDPKYYPRYYWKNLTSKNDTFENMKWALYTKGNWVFRIIADILEQHALKLMISQFPTIKEDVIQLEGYFFEQFCMPTKGLNIKKILLVKLHFVLLKQRRIIIPH